MINVTGFDSEECQALCDVIEKLLLIVTIVDPYNETPMTIEEHAAVTKLREAARFYIPQRRPM